jgi:hypothetical protein
MFNLDVEYTSEIFVNQLYLTGETQLLKEKSSRPLKKITKCPHTEEKHYAKNMCNNCYHSKGRKKKPSKCSHGDKHHYAFGYCQNCYQLKYLKV